MNNLSSFLFDQSKYILKKENQNINPTYFTASEREDPCHFVEIFFRNSLTGSLDKQKSFFFEVEILKDVCCCPLFVQFEGFSLSILCPKDNVSYPAIAFERFPLLPFIDIQKDVGLMSPTIKSKIAFGVLTALDIIFSHKRFIDAFFLSPNCIYLDPISYEPKIFYSPFNLSPLSGCYYYWDAPEISVEERTSSSAVFSFAMFLYELLGIDKYFFKQSKASIISKFKSDESFTLSADNPISNLLNICLLKKPAFRPTLRNILKMFVYDNICFEKTDMDEFNDYKRRVYKSLGRKITKHFYTESYLLAKTNEGSMRKRYLLARMIKKDDTRKDEFLKLILPLVQFRDVKATKLYLRFYLYNSGYMKDFPIEAPIAKDIVKNDQKASQLYAMYQIFRGKEEYATFSCFSSDPIAQIEYAKVVSNLQHERLKLNSYEIFSFYWNALLNPKLKMFSKKWELCKKEVTKLIKTEENLTGFEDKTNTNDDNIVLLTKLLCTPDRMTEEMFQKVAEMAKKGDEELSYFYGRYLLENNSCYDSEKLNEILFFFKNSMTSLCYYASYSMAIAYLRSLQYDNAVFLLNSCTKCPIPFISQMSSEALAEIYIDGIGMKSSDLAMAVSYINWAPKKTEKKRYLMSVFAKEKNIPLISVHDANIFFETSEYPLMILHRFCENYIEKVFPKTDNESAEDYNLRIDSTLESKPELNLLLSFRYLIGYHIERNSYIALKLINDAIQDLKKVNQKNENENEINEEEKDNDFLLICKAAFHILSKEDHREACDVLHLANLQHYSRNADIVGKEGRNDNNIGKKKETILKVKRDLNSYLGDDLTLCQLKSLSGLAARAVPDAPPMGDREDDLLEWFSRNWEAIEPLICDISL